MHGLANFQRENTVLTLAGLLSRWILLAVDIVHLLNIVHVRSPNDPRNVRNDHMNELSRVVHAWLNRMRCELVIVQLCISCLSKSLFPVSLPTYRCLVLHLLFVMFVAHVLCFLFSPVCYSAPVQSTCVRVGIVSSLGSPTGDQRVRLLCQTILNPSI
jgi:hypothetical protein